MPEYYGHDYDLPLEIDEDELRYIVPQIFIPAADKRGWGVSVEEYLDGNHYKVLYEMSRWVPLSLDDAEVADLQDRIGIIDDDGEIIDGYGLWADDDPPASETKLLYFEFEGFPTAHTMEVIDRLMEAYESETKQSRWYRLLGYFGLINTRSQA